MGPGFPGAFPGSKDAAAERSFRPNSPARARGDYPPSLVCRASSGGWPVLSPCVSQKGLRDCISPTCTLSQNGYGDRESCQTTCPRSKLAQSTLCRASFSCWMPGRPKADSTLSVSVAIFLRFSYKNQPKPARAAIFSISAILRDSLSPPPRDPQNCGN